MILYGVALRDVTSVNFPREVYGAWYNMVKRCYDPAYWEKRPHYRDCYVAEPWLRFSTFSRWMMRQDYGGKQLDKDLLIPGNRLYSASTCIFLPAHINRLIVTDLSYADGDLPRGVCYTESPTNPYMAYIGGGKTSRRYLGSYPTARDAHRAYCKAKANLFLSTAAAQTDKRIAKGLRAWARHIMN